jgi:hypothetical protein
MCDGPGNIIEFKEMKSCNRQRTKSRSWAGQALPRAHRDIWLVDMFCSFKVYCDIRQTS